MAVVPGSGDGRRRPRPGTWPAVLAWLRIALRVALCVLVLLATALDAWLTALVGLPPLLPRVRRLAATLARVLAAECRACATTMTDPGVVDAEVIDTDQEVWR
ncbi:hypothetical protein [Microbispora triticiradicis]|uniref:hypothetical protein n=1 Tax=Microbispora triticiradicis TaxID=2200763 RepID=UPI001AD75FDC|nr:hypothetical protein [Microbispora triticiradicis]MBO4274946.1 hypothetical protein [Microbispora triticiradicis]